MLSLQPAVMPAAGQDEHEHDHPASSEITK
jgi:hypothetical protein